jgi:hypothetical protein
MPMQFYWLSHCRVGTEDSKLGDHEDNEKDLGRYSTQSRALAAVERLKRKPGFRDWPGGFRILSGECDHGGWETGFASIYDWDDLNENGRPKAPEMLPNPDPSVEPLPPDYGPPSADDVPFWARGLRPYLEDTPEQFACRLMDDRYGRETWFDAAFAIGEVRNLKKWARVDAGIAEPIAGSPLRKARRPKRGGRNLGGSSVLYQLHHFRLEADEDWVLDHEDNEKEIGLYSSLAALKTAINERADQEGFRDWLGGFRIFIVMVDQDYWEEGFIRIHDPAFLDPPDDAAP